MGLEESKSCAFNEQQSAACRATRNRRGLQRWTRWRCAWRACPPPGAAPPVRSQVPPTSHCLLSFNGCLLHQP